jgi:acetyltransferase-like isoleucine patch superfamily enzyme
VSQDKQITQVRGQFSIVSEDCEIGDGSCIWNFVYIAKGVKIGAGVTIGSMAHISDGSVIGDRTQVEGSAHISRYSVIGKDCFIGPNATLTSDPFPPVRRSTGVAAWASPVLEDGVIIGANAVIRAGVTIGHRSVVGMGAVVVKDVPPESVVVGSPARFVYPRSEYDRKQEDWARAAGDSALSRIGRLGPGIFAMLAR